MRDRSSSTDPAAWWALPLAGLGVLTSVGWFATVPDPRETPLLLAAVWAAGCVAVLLATRAALRRPRAEVVLLTLLFSAALRAAVLPMATTLSDDFLRYLWDGREVLAGRSPYAATPEEALEARGAGPAEAELLGGMNSGGFRSVYPPVSQAAFAAAWSWGQGTVWGGVLVLRGIFGLVDLAAVGVLLLVLQRTGRHPGRAVLYAWHPLPVVEAVGGMHTEAVLALPLLLAVGLVAPRTVGENGPGSRRSAAAGAAGAVGAAGVAGVAVAVAAAVKLFPLAAAAVLAGRLRGRARWVLLAAAGLGAAVLLWPVLGSPHGSGVRASLALYAGYFSFNSPLFDAAKHLFELHGFDEGRAARWASRALLVVFAAAAAGILWRTWRGPGSGCVPALLMCLFGAYLLCSATIHPWYVLWVLWLIPLTRSARPAVLWLAATIPLTYTAYDPAFGGWGVPWWAMLTQWGGVLVLLLFADARPLWIGPLMRARARWKAAKLANHLPTNEIRGRLLDVGCGEGLVTAELGRRTGLEPVGVDVHPVPAAPEAVAVAVLPYDGWRLPFADGAFAATTVLTVLHHCDDPDAVLAEAVRVTRSGGRLLVAESVYRTRGGLWLLTRLDRFFNGLRGGGREGLAGPLRFAREGVWVERFASVGLKPVETRYLSRGLHRHVLFVLDRPAVGADTVRA